MNAARTAPIVRVTISPFSAQPQAQRPMNEITVHSLPGYTVVTEWTDHPLNSS